MLDKKRRLFRLIETYINDCYLQEIEEMYGKGTRVKIHSMTESPTSKSLLFEAIIILGDTITEDVMDRKLVDVLIQDALVYFYPEYHIKTYVRWDV